MSIRTFLAVLRAASRQAVTDLRSSLVAMSVALLASVSAIVVVGRHTQMNAEAHATFGPMFLASSIGTISGFIALQIASETYTDRIGGALLRVRILPHGPLTWAIGKTMSSITHTLVFQGAILLGGALFVEAMAVQLVLPTYWSGHLTRWALVGDPSWEVGGAFSPVLAVGVLAAWTVLGFAGAAFIVRRSFRKETIGSLVRVQSTIRSQSGL